MEDNDAVIIKNKQTKPWHGEVDNGWFGNLYTAMKIHEVTDVWVTERGYGRFWFHYQR